MRIRNTSTRKPNRGRRPTDTRTDRRRDRPISNVRASVGIGFQIEKPFKTIIFSIAMTTCSIQSFSRTYASLNRLKGRNFPSTEGVDWRRKKYWRSVVEKSWSVSVGLVFFHRFSVWLQMQKCSQLRTLVNTEHKPMAEWWTRITVRTCYCKANLWTPCNWMPISFRLKTFQNSRKERRFPEPIYFYLQFQCHKNV